MAGQSVAAVIAATPPEFLAAAQTLANGTGPFAIDTERASSFRYDDRAFLLQIRRAGAGTFLLDPEGGRAELTQALVPVLNGAAWILHAAPSDLPCLSWLGLSPGTLFDTELAARMAGIEHPNLSAVTELLLGVELEKGFGDADWSVRPLPAELLDYAALDVEYLLELAEVLTDILAEGDKLEWAYAEFAAITSNFIPQTAPPATDWRDLKGVNALRDSAQLAVAAALWTARDRIAKRQDQAPGKILPNRTLIDIARALPRSAAALRKVRGFPSRRVGALQHWFSVIDSVYRSDPAGWPVPDRTRPEVPRKTTWSREYPELWEIYQSIRTDLDALAQELVMQPETIARTADIRHLVWAIRGPVGADRPGNVAGSITRRDQVRPALLDRGVREWQADLVAPIIVLNCF